MGNATMTEQLDEGTGQEPQDAHLKRPGVKFRVIQAFDKQKLSRQANEAMALIEDNGGEYVGSHWSSVSNGDRVFFSLVIVYRQRARRRPARPGVR